MPAHLLGPTTPSPGASKFSAPIRPTPRSNFSPIGLSSLLLSSSTATASASTSAKGASPSATSPGGALGPAAISAPREPPRWSPLGDAAAALRPGTLREAADGMPKGPTVGGGDNDEACVAKAKVAAAKPTKGDLRVGGSNGPIPTTIQPSTLPPSIAEDVAAGADETITMASPKQTAKAPETGAAPAAAAVPSKQSSGSKICLSRWSLVVVPNNPGITRLDRSVTEDWIVLVGRRPDMAEMWHSSLITGRISEREITTGSGRVYSLEGPADELALIEAGFSFETVEAFKLGFPESWQLVLVQEFGNAKSRVGGHPETPRGLAAAAALVAPKKRSRQAQDHLNPRSKSAVPSEEPARSLPTASIRGGEPGSRGTAVSAEISLAQPVKRGRGRPPKAKNGGPSPSSVPLRRPEADHVGDAKENDPRTQHQEDASSLAQNPINPVITSPRSYVPPGGKIIATPPGCSPRIKAGDSPSGDRESRRHGSSGKRQKGSEASSRWCDLPESPLSTISGTDISILGRTRSGRRVVAPLPYWENKYVRSIPNASQSPILRLRPSAGAR